MGTRTDRRLDRISKKFILFLASLAVLFGITCFGYAIGIDMQNKNLIETVINDDRIPFDIRKQYIKK